MKPTDAMIEAAARTLYFAFKDASELPSDVFKQAGEGHFFTALRLLFDPLCDLAILPHEPVAWQYKDAWGRWAYCQAIDNVNGPTVVTEKQALYATPYPIPDAPQRAAVTREMVLEAKALLTEWVGYEDETGRARKEAIIAKFDALIQERS